MATLKQTQTSSDIGKEPDIDSLYINPAANKAASIYANPMQLLGGLPKPSIIRGAAQAGLAGIRSGMAMPTASPEASALTGALTGIVAGPAYEQQYAEQQMANIDMLPIEQVSPSLVEAFPEARGIPLGIFQKLSGIFSAMSKQRAQPTVDVLDESDVPAIRLTLKTKGYDDNEIDDAMPGLMGQTWGVIKGLLSKTRLAREQATQDVIPNEFGIPVKFLETDKVSGRKREKESRSNVAVSSKLADIGKGKSIMDQLYQEMSLLSDSERSEMAAVSRIKGGILTLLGRPGIGGETAEKVKNIKNIIEANIPLIARSLGHVGVLTELDVLKSFGVMPEVTQSTRELEYRKQLVDKLIGANVSNTIKSATPLLGVGIDYNTLANAMNLPVEYLRAIPGGAKDNKPKTPKDKSTTLDFSDDAFSKFMKGKE